MGRLELGRKCLLALSLASVACAAAAISAIPTFGQGKPPKAAAAVAPTSSFDYRAKVISDLKDMGGKLVELGKAMPADKFTWHPDGQGLSTVAEVYLLAATEYYHIPSEFGAIRAETYEVGTASDSNRKGAPRNIPFEKAMTDKAQIMDELFDAVSYFGGSMEALSDSDLQKHIKMLGRDTTPDEVLLAMANDIHEYLAQAMDYAQMNGVVLPWMTEMQLAKKKRGERAPTK
jgi:hypothetical protein